MNEKHAKELRRKARELCEAHGVKSEIDYRVVPQRVQFAGAMTTLLEPMSKARIERLDMHRDRARAQRLGVVVSWLLQSVYGEPQIVRPQIILGACFRGIYQRAKKALRYN